MSGKSYVLPDPNTSRPGINLRASGFGVISVVINKFRVEIRQLGASRVRARLNILEKEFSIENIFENLKHCMGSVRSHVEHFSWLFAFFDSFLNSFAFSVGHRGKRVQMMRFI